MAQSASQPQQRTVSQETRQRQSRAQINRRQAKFVQEYAHTGNATAAARAAGYTGNSNTLGVTASRDLLGNPKVKAELARVEAQIAVSITPDRVKRRLHEISHASEAAGQFGPAVRSEELLGKSIGMWVDQSLHLSGVLSDSHVAALLEIARRRQAEPVDLVDDIKVEQTDE